MAQYGVIGGGVILLVIAAFGLLVPVTTDGFTYPQLQQLCDSGVMEGFWFELGYEMLYGPDWEYRVQKECDFARMIVVAIPLTVIAGVVVMGVGWIMNSKKIVSSIDILRDRYAKGEITKDEFEQKKNDLENS